MQSCRDVSVGQWLEKMEEEGVSASAESYNAAIRYFASMRNGKGALAARSWFDRMLEAGISATEETYTQMIAAYAGANHTDEAGQWLSKLAATGIRPHMSAYSALMQGYARAKDPAGVRQILDWAVLEGLTPNAGSYNIAIRAFAEAGDAASAEEMYKRLTVAGRYPNEKTFLFLIQCHARLLDFDRARAWFKEMLSMDVKPTFPIYAAMIRGAAVAGRADETSETGSRFLEEMSTRRMTSKIDRSTWEAMMVSALRCFDQAGDQESVERWIEYSEDQGFPDLSPDTKVWMQGFALKQPGCLWAVSDIEKELKILEEMKAEGEIPTIWDFNKVMKAFAVSQQPRFSMAKAFLMNTILPVTQPNEITWTLLLRLEPTAAIWSVMSFKNKYPLVGRLKEEEDEEVTPAALIKAAERGDLGRLRRQLKQGADITWADADGLTALHWAARSGKEAIVELLLSAGADAEGRDKKGRTSLHWAATMGQAAVAEKLLEATDPEAEAADAWLPLHFAAQGGHVEVIQALLRRGADVNRSPALRVVFAMISLACQWMPGNRCNRAGDGKRGVFTLESMVDMQAAISRRHINVVLRQLFSDFRSGKILEIDPLLDKILALLPKKNPKKISDAYNQIVAEMSDAGQPDLAKEWVSRLRAAGYELQALQCNKLAQAYFLKGDELSALWWLENGLPRGTTLRQNLGIFVDTVTTDGNKAGVGVVVKSGRQHFGFIKLEEPPFKLYFRRKGIVDFDGKLPSPGTRVRFDVIQEEDGQQLATNVVVAAAPPAFVRSRYAWPVPSAVRAQAPSECFPEPSEGFLSSLRTMDEKVTVIVTGLSGASLEVRARRDDSMLMVRQEASHALGITAWQLRLLQLNGELANTGVLGDLLPSEEDTLDLTAVTMRHRPDVLQNSEDLAMALGSRKGALNKHRENILQGDIDFNYKGNNLLERAVTNLPPGDVEEFASVLMNGGADVNRSSRDGYTPLLSACSRGLAKVAQTLLQRGARRQEVGPRGSTALAEALAFFKACVEYRAYERRLCCGLRSDSIEMARRQGLPELTLARLRLSAAATEKALLGSAGVTLTQEEILAKSGLDKSFAEGLGPDLWAGWPYAFLSFGLEIPTRAKTASQDFTNARSRILSFKLSQEKKEKPEPPCMPGLDYCDVESNMSYMKDYYVCDCPFCCPELYIGFEQWAHEIKTRNRKWMLSDRALRRRLATAGASGASRWPTASVGTRTRQGWRAGCPQLTGGTMWRRHSGEDTKSSGSFSLFRSSFGWTHARCDGTPLSTPFPVKQAAVQTQTDDFDESLLLDLNAGEEGDVLKNLRDLPSVLEDALGECAQAKKFATAEVCSATAEHIETVKVCMSSQSSSSSRSSWAREAGGRTALGQSVQNIREAASRHIASLRQNLSFSPAVAAGDEKRTTSHDKKKKKARALKLTAVPASTPESGSGVTVVELGPPTDHMVLCRPPGGC
eukprot:s2090_g2.t3